jgi:hypothetical protein
MRDESSDPKPLNLISLNVIICEKLLHEKDGVFSAVRMVDIFYFRHDPDNPDLKIGIPMCFLVTGRFPPEDDTEHSVSVFIVRPNGDTTPLGNPLVTSMTMRPANPAMRTALLAEESQSPHHLNGGFNFVAEIGLIPKQTGLHFVAVYIDGYEVAQVPFTVLEMKPRQTTTD